MTECYLMQLLLESKKELKDHAFGIHIDVEVNTWIQKGIERRLTNVARGIMRFSLESKKELKGEKMMGSSENVVGHLNPKRNWKLPIYIGFAWVMGMLESKKELKALPPTPKHEIHHSHLNPKRNWKYYYTPLRTPSRHTSWIQKGIESLRLPSAVIGLLRPPWIQKGIESKLCRAIHQHPIPTAAWIQKGIERGS